MSRPHKLAALLAAASLAGCMSVPLAVPLEDAGPTWQEPTPASSPAVPEPIPDYNFSLSLGYRRVPDFGFGRDQFLMGVAFDASPAALPIGFEASAQWSGYQSDSGDWYGYWYVPDDDYRETEYLDLALGLRKCFQVSDHVQVYAGGGATWIDADQEEAILFPVFLKRSASDSLWAPYVRGGVRVFVDRSISVGLEAMGIFAGDLDMLSGKEDGSAWSIAFVTGFGF